MITEEEKQIIQEKVLLMSFEAKAKILERIRRQEEAKKIEELNNFRDKLIIEGYGKLSITE